MTRGEETDDTAQLWAVPRTGEALRRLAEDFALEGDMPLEEFAQLLELSVSALKRVFTQKRLKPELRARLREIVTWSPADLPIPRTGNGLKKLLKELEEMGVSMEEVAEGTGLSVSSLRQYTYLKKLPKKFQQRLRTYFDGGDE